MAKPKLYDKRDYLRYKAIPSPTDEWRSEFRRDYGRVIHSGAFRRMQGKTQLFPALETDFFRTRLTHSIEVAQIAKSIALRLNSQASELEKSPIDTDLVEVAALCHDIGHPPFGHNGEKVLDQCMRKYGGFEGNAQTLRLLTSLEKREIGSGLNLTARSLAAVLKYDAEIPVVRSANESHPQKGYYASEKELVDWFKGEVSRGKSKPEKFRTIECSIMDVSDDIAYSTYDLEDAFKAGFLKPLDLLSPAQEILMAVAEGVSQAVGRKVDPDEIISVLRSVFRQLIEFPNHLRDELVSKDSQVDALFDVIDIVHDGSRRLAAEGSLRTRFTSQLVGEYVRSVQLKYNDECPQFSSVFLPPEELLKVEVLKQFSYEALIRSPALRIGVARAEEVLREIFGHLTKEDGGHDLLPNDFKRTFSEARTENRHRVVCDFVAGMTDRYAVEFYARIKSDSAQTIFRPV